MARGKHARSVAMQKTAETADAKERARVAEIEQRRLQGIIDDKDQELATLRSALSEARKEHTVRGTYTEADISELKAQAAEQHQSSVLDGVKHLGRHFDMRPETGQYVTEVIELSKLFGVDAMKLMDVLIGFTEEDEFIPSSRRERRPKKSAAQVVEEVRAELRKQELTHALAPELSLNYTDTKAQSLKGMV